MTIHWKTDFLNQLNNLKSTDYSYFDDLNNFSIQLAISNQTNAFQQTEIQDLKTKNTDLLNQINHLQENIQDHPKQQELLEQINQLNSEQKDLYKSNAINTQRIVNLMDQVQDYEKTIKDLTTERDDLLKQNKTLTQKLADTNELIGEKDRVIQILRDELSTHQLELVQREEQLKDCQQKLKDIEKENKDLVERWIEEKEKVAKQMNQANEYVETALKTKESLSNRVFSIFRTNTESQKSFERTSDVHSSILPTKFYKQFKNAHDDEISALAINSDGSLLASGGNDKKLILHDIASGSPKTVLTGSLQAIMSICFNRFGDLVLASSNDNSTKVWDINSRRLLHTLTGHHSKIYASKFTDTNSVISGSHDRTIKIWDLTKGYCIKTIFTLSSCNDLSPMSADGSLIASGHLDNNLRIWDAKSGNNVREISGLHFGQITCVQVSSGMLFYCIYSTDEQKIMTTSRDNTIKVVDIRMYNCLYTCRYIHLFNSSAAGFRPGSNFSKSCFSSDNQFIASGSSDGKVYVWKDSKLVSTLSKHSSNICGVVWSPLGGSNLFSVSDRERAIVQWTHDD
ncbi:WD40-repeat-containing domain protein [Globomyces pollinis-pini]|nr:WD40-repeat-containing domain protein [Globomyces pollinis-pini]